MCAPTNGGVAHTVRRCGALPPSSAQCLIASLSPAPFAHDSLLGAAGFLTSLRGCAIIGENRRRLEPGGDEPVNQPLLPRPRFWVRAAEEKKVRTTLAGDMIRLMIVFLIATVLESLLMSLPITFWVMTQDHITLGGFGFSSIEKMIAEMMKDLPPWMEVAILFAAAAYGIAAIFYCRKFEKRSFGSMGLGRKSALPETFGGLAAGLLLFAALTAIGSAAGGFRISPFALDQGQLPLLILALLGCAAAGGARELLFRGYFAPSIGAGLPVTFALVVSTFASLLASGSGNGFVPYVNLILLNLLFGVLVIKRGNLWAAIGLHTGWLYAGNFLFGFDLPADDRLCLFRVESAGYRKLLTGGSAGPEGSLCATLVLLAALAAVYALRARDPAPRQTPKDPERPDAPDGQI